MKKIVVALLVAAMMLMSLVSCSSSGTSTAAPDASEASAVTDTVSDVEGENTEAAATGDVIVGMCPKFTSDPYMIAASEGAQEACDELGYTLDFNGPVDADVAAQSDIINQWIQKGYTAITVSANDPDALAPAMQSAQDAGIYTSGWDADTQPEVRDFFLNQATFEGIGRTMAEIMVEEAGDKGEFLIVTSTLTAPNQNAWIEELEKYLAENYPDMVIADILPGDEDLAKSRDVTLNYLRSHPDTTGVFAMTGMASPGVCEAIEQLDMVGDVAVTGLGVPSLIREYTKKGTVNKTILWSPYDIGYGAMYLVKTQVEGNVEQALEDGYIEAGRLGQLEIIDTENGIVLLGDPLVFTKDNIDDFDF